jgi:hypothetical protein
MKRFENRLMECILLIGLLAMVLLVVGFKTFPL